MSRAILFVLALIVIGAGQAEAVPVTFTFQGTGTGTAGNASFSNAAFTFTTFADTDGVREFNREERAFDTLDSPTTINIAGVGSGVFTLDKRVFVVANRSILGLTDALGIQFDLMVLTNPAFTTYGLVTNVGPVFDPAPRTVNRFQNVQSSFGLLSFSSIINVSFTAVTTNVPPVPTPTPNPPVPNPVPEPATMILLGTGLAGIGGMIKRRRKAKDA